MINDLSRPKPRSRRSTLVAALVLITLAAFALAWQTRSRAPGFPPLLELYLYKLWTPAAVRVTPERHYNPFAE